MTVAASPLNASQVLILQFLSRQTSPRGVTRQDINDKCPKAGATVDNLGVSRGGAKPGSLYALGMVTAEQHDVDGRMVTLYKITDKGRAAAKKMKVKATRVATVDPLKLDKVVIEFRPTRTYGMENYTDDDIREIKDKLNGGAQQVSISDLRQQIANRRKQGAYADPTERVKRLAKSAIAAFGPGGWAHDGLFNKSQMNVLMDMAATGKVGTSEEIETIEDEV
jgi:DNA-binding PadR family transcriptional regulator